jgi:dolichyl-phosphate mannosyltransferase polypeptide 2 regulatory subunit
MAASTDKVIGFVLLFISIFVFVYYTFWVIIAPFIDRGHFIQDWFLPRSYAIVLPIVAAIVLTVGVLTFIAIVMIRSNKKAAPKSQ